MIIAVFFSAINKELEDKDIKSFEGKSNTKMFLKYTY